MPQQKSSVTMTERLRQDTLISHLIELRTRLLISVVAWLVCASVVYVFMPQVLAFLTQPLQEAYANSEQKRLIFTSLPEAFTTYLSTAMFVGFLAAFPIISAQLYRFLAPGLYANEKRAMLPFMIAAPSLFYAGAALAYFFIFPMAWKFFVSFEISTLGVGGMAVELEAKISEYLALIRAVVIAFGLAFQLPLGLTLLVKAGLISVDTLKKGRRYAIVILLTAAAILTPPDIISQIGLFSALYILYECAIIASSWVSVRKGDAEG
jgi:sec-independent protein translocase protein TatC